MTSSAANTQPNPPVTAVKSEPGPSEEPKPSTSAEATPNAAEPKDIKPDISGGSVTGGAGGSNSSSTPKAGPSSTGGTPGSAGSTGAVQKPRQYNRMQARTQIMPRLQ